MNNSQNFVSVPVIIVIGLVAVIIIILIARTLRKRATLVKNYADKHGYVVGTVGTDFSDVESVYLRKPNMSTRFSLVMTGKLQTLPFRMFNYTDRTGPVKNSNIEAVLEVSHNLPVPSFLVYRRIGIIHHDRYMPRDFKKIAIDENFNTYLEVFAQEGKESEVLSYLTKERKDLLLDLIHHHTSAAAYSNNLNGFEFTPHKLYIYRFMFGKEVHLDESINAAEKILTRFK